MLYQNIVIEDIYVLTCPPPLQSEIAACRILLMCDVWMGTEDAELPRPHRQWRCLPPTQTSASIQL